ncbi:MAG: hypothetical protein MZV64_10735 [Ignavibacteriales bacterium]|nr:hypothetical protein [Ignavibacteriales bacterium]
MIRIKTTPFSSRSRSVDDDDLALTRPEPHDPRGKIVPVLEARRLRPLQPGGDRDDQVDEVRGDGLSAEVELVELDPDLAVPGFEAAGEQQVLLLRQEARRRRLAEVDGDAALVPVLFQQLEFRELDEGLVRVGQAAGDVGVELRFREGQAAGARRGGGGRTAGGRGRLRLRFDPVERGGDGGRPGPDLGRHFDGGRRCGDEQDNKPCTGDGKVLCGHGYRIPGDMLADSGRKIPAFGRYLMRKGDTTMSS